MAGAGSVVIARKLCIAFGALLALFGAAASHAQDLTRLPNVVDKVAPSVVSISTEPPKDSKIGVQTGSGIVLSSDGFIATAAFIVEGVPSANVTFSDGRMLIGAVVGADPRSNVAILKVQPAAVLKEATLGDSDLVRRGQPVFVIGNPFGFKGSVSLGIISATGRSIGENNPYDYLQTDAALNQGNAGGPLFDFDGNVIGMAQSLYTPAASAGSVGIGFALPSNAIRDVAQQIQATGTMKRGWLGARLQDVTPETAESLGLAEGSGAIIVEVVAGGPGAASGLKSGDVIVAIGDTRVTDSKSCARAVGANAPSSRIDFKVWRDRSYQTIKVTLGTFPAMPPAPTPQQQQPAASNQGGTGGQPVPLR